MRQNTSVSTGKALDNGEKVSKKFADSELGAVKIDARMRILEVKLCRKYYERKRQGQKCTEKWVRKTAKHMMSEGSFSASHGWFRRFQKRHGIVQRVTTNSSSQSTEKKEALIRDYLQRLRMEIRENGPFPPSRIANMDQTPMPFALWAGKTLANKGDKQVWVKNPKSVDEKRFCSVHLTVFGDGKHRVKPLVIFRGQGKRLTLKERAQWHSGVKVEFQTNAWMDEVQVKKYVKSQLARNKPEGKLLLTLDAHGSQRKESVRQLMAEKDIIDVEVAKGCTGEVQVLGENLYFMTKL